MLPLEQLAEFTLPDGTLLALSRRGDAHYLHADRRLILSSATRRFDEALAQTCAEACRRRKSPRILLGHLGLGFTLFSLLQSLPSTARISVCEDVTPLVTWHKEHLFGEEISRAMADPRVSLVSAPLLKFLRKKQTPGFDAVVLGLDEEVHPHSAARLRDPDAVFAAISCLREFGTLIYTSLVQEKEFAQSLVKMMPMQTEGFTIFLNPEKKKGPRQNILLARPELMPS